MFQSIALRYAMSKKSASTIWFRKVVGAKLDTVYHEWMIRAALYHGDWKLVIDSIDSLATEERLSPRWQYWYARALDKLGQKTKANEIFSKVGKMRNYHGFLASRHIKSKMHLNHDELAATSDDKDRITSLPAFQRAKILFEMDQINDAKLELIYLMKYSNFKDQYLILKFADAWDWDKHILHMSRFVDHKDDLKLRFPLLYQSHIAMHAKIRKLDPALVFAIIRQESHFSPGAKSHAGAIGLMQLMPATAYKTSRQFKLKYKGTKDLVNGKTNIVFGCAHLRKLHQQLSNHPVLVIASYNAGKNAVKRWIPKDKNIPADIWIETIPYYETRNYLKNVIAYHVVYQHRLGNQAKLDSIMKAVKPIKVK